MRVKLTGFSVNHIEDESGTTSLDFTLSDHQILKCDSRISSVFDIVLQFYHIIDFLRCWLFSSFERILIDEFKKFQDWNVNLVTLLANRIVIMIFTSRLISYMFFFFYISFKKKVWNMPPIQPVDMHVSSVRPIWVNVFFQVFDYSQSLLKTVWVYTIFFFFLYKILVKPSITWVFHSIFFFLN